MKKSRKWLLARVVFSAGNRCHTKVIGSVRHPNGLVRTQEPSGNGNTTLVVSGTTTSPPPPPPVDGAGRVSAVRIASATG